MLELVYKIMMITVNITITAVLATFTYVLVAALIDRIKKDVRRFRDRHNAAAVPGGEKNRYGPGLPGKQSEQIYDMSAESPATDVVEKEQPANPHHHNMGYIGVKIERMKEKVARRKRFDELYVESSPGDFTLRTDVTDEEPRGPEEFLGGKGNAFYQEERAETIHELIRDILQAHGVEIEHLEERVDRLDVPKVIRTGTVAMVADHEKAIKEYCRTITPRRLARLEIKVDNLETAEKMRLETKPDESPSDRWKGVPTKIWEAGCSCAEPETHFEMQEPVAFEDGEIICDEVDEKEDRDKIEEPRPTTKPGGAYNFEPVHSSLHDDIKRANRHR